MVHFTSGVYAIKNLVNGKVYIGSSNRIERRKISHFSALRNGSHYNAHLQRAFNKYGEVNIQLLVLAVCAEKDLLDTEQRYIDEHRATDRRHGYNVWLTTHKTIQSDEMRANLSKAHLGHKHPPEVRAKISAALRVRVRTPETREKLRIAMTGRKLSPRTIAKRTASRNYGPLSDGHKRKISEGNKGKQVSETTRQKLAQAQPRAVSVVQLDLDGTPLRRFDSIALAASSSGIARSNISTCTSGSRTTAGGYKWAKS
jgi:group I intron endonuclease